MIEELGALSCTESWKILSYLRSLSSWESYSSFPVEVDLGGFSEAYHLAAPVLDFTAPGSGFTVIG